MGQELSNCPSADGTFLSSTFPNTHSLFATNAKTVYKLNEQSSFNFKIEK